MRVPSIPRITPTFDRPHPVGGTRYMLYIPSDAECSRLDSAKDSPSEIADIISNVPILNRPEGGRFRMKRFWLIDRHNDIATVHKHTVSSIKMSRDQSLDLCSTHSVKRTKLASVISLASSESPPTTLDFKSLSSTRASSPKRITTITPAAPKSSASAVLRDFVPPASKASSRPALKVQIPAPHITKPIALKSPLNPMASEFSVPVINPKSESVSVPTSKTEPSPVQKTAKVGDIKISAGPGTSSAYFDKIVQSLESRNQQGNKTDTSKPDSDLALDGVCESKISKLTPTTASFTPTVTSVTLNSMLMSSKPDKGKETKGPAQEKPSTEKSATEKHTPAATGGSIDSPAAPAPATAPGKTSKTESQTTPDGLPLSMPPIPVFQPFLGPVTAHDVVTLSKQRPINCVPLQVPPSPASLMSPFMGSFTAPGIAPFAWPVVEKIPPSPIGSETPLPFVPMQSGLAVVSSAPSPTPLRPGLPGSHTPRLMASRPQIPPPGNQDARLQQDFEY